MRCQTKAGKEGHCFGPHAIVKIALCKLWNEYVEIECFPWNSYIPGRRRVFGDPALSVFCASFSTPQGSQICPAIDLSFSASR